MSLAENEVTPKYRTPLGLDKIYDEVELTDVLEATLHNRPPFSLLIHGTLKSYSSLMIFDPEYKQSLTDRLLSEGFTKNGVTIGLKALRVLAYNNGMRVSGASEMDIATHFDDRYTGLTFNKPEEVTAVRLRAECDSLGETGANAILAILVEASNEWPALVNTK